MSRSLEAKELRRLARCWLGCLDCGGKTAERTSLPSLPGAPRRDAEPDGVVGARVGGIWSIVRGVRQCHAVAQEAPRSTPPPVRRWGPPAGELTPARAGPAGSPIPKALGTRGLHQPLEGVPRPQARRTARPEAYVPFARLGAPSSAGLLWRGSSGGRSTSSQRGPLAGLALHARRGGRRRRAVTSWRGGLPRRWRSAPRNDAALEGLFRTAVISWRRGLPRRWRKRASQEKDGHLGRLFERALRRRTTWWRGGWPRASAPGRRSAPLRPGGWRTR